jgi:hypothetical protein
MATTNDDSSAADVTPVSSQPSQESSLSSQSLRSLPLANLGRRATTHTQDTLRRLSKPALREGVEGGAAVGTPVADHIYEHLFFAEEQARREQQQQQHHTPRQLSNRIPDELPRNRRQRSPPSLSAAARTGIHSPNVQPKKRHTGSTNLSKPFPVSSPNRDKPVLSVASPSLPCTAHGISIPQCPTFDDGISAISANTLEAMAKQPPQQRQQASRAAVAAVTPNSASLFPRVTVHNDYGPVHPRKPVQHNRRPSPQQPSRNEPTIRTFPTLPCSPPRGTGAGLTTSSAGTTQVVNIVHASNFSPPRCQRNNSVTSPVRHGTPQSRSTRTSHSSGGTSKLSFENWQSVEQQFWESVVQEDSDVKKKKKRHAGHNSSRRRHSEHRYRRGDATLSTASSTAPSRSSSWLEKHPHDTVSYEPSDFFASTALYPDDEEAEI